LISRGIGCWNEIYKVVKLKHKKLIKLLQKAYSAEKAAAFAYQGHASSVRDKEAKLAIKQIEIDEWEHREEVKKIMEVYAIPVSKYNELQFHIIGKIISFSCFIIGRFMPYYFAGRLESGNVCEYFKMKHYFNSLGITTHDQILYQMGIKEKEHEVYFLERVKNDKWLSVFEKVFLWGKRKSFNNVDLKKTYPVEESDIYCKSGKEIY
jgi:ferritin-like metal-binding protein YciE